MRLLLTVITLATVTVLCASQASAECYGDTAQMYGCGTTNPTSPKNIGELVYFGGESAPVIPDRGRTTTSLTDDLFSPQEYRGMLRSIVRGQGLSSYSRGAEIRAMIGGSRPIRRVGNTRVTVYGR